MSRLSMGGHVLARLLVGQQIPLIVFKKLCNRRPWLAHVKVYMLPWIGAQQVNADVLLPPTHWTENTLKVYNFHHSGTKCIAQGIEVACGISLIKYKVHGNRYETLWCLENFSLFIDMVFAIIVIVVQNCRMTESKELSCDTLLSPISTN